MEEHPARARSAAAAAAIFMPSYSEKPREDLYHIAHAVVGGAQFLVTWDTGDLARRGTQEVVRRYCLSKGRHEFLIETPVEVARWLDVAIL